MFSDEFNTSVKIIGLFKNVLNLIIGEDMLSTYFVGNWAESDAIIVDSNACMKIALMMGAGGGPRSKVCY